LRLDFQESAKTLGFVFFASGQQAGSFYSRSASLRASLRRKEGSFLNLPTLTASHTLASVWANLWSRLTALHYRNDGIVVHPMLGRK
jgi:hypothetical protein